MDAESKYKILVDTVLHSVQESDETGTITFANKQTEQITHYSVDEIVGKKKIWDMVIPEEREKNKKEFFQLLKDQPTPYPFITKHLTKDGNVIDVQVDWNYRRDEKGKVIGFISILTDITKYTKAHGLLEQKVRERTIELERANNILKLTSEVSRRLLAVDSFDIASCLQIIANSMKIDQLYICYRNGKVRYSSITKHDADNFSIVRRSLKLEDCAWCLKNQKYMFEGKIKDFPVQSCIANDKDLDNKDLNYIVLPIYIYDELWGMIGFGRKTEERWSTFEIDALSNLGRLIAIIVNNEESETSLANHIEHKFGQVQELLDEE